MDLEHLQQTILIISVLLSSASASYCVGLNENSVCHTLETWRNYVH